MPNVPVKSTVAISDPDNIFVYYARLKDNYSDFAYLKGPAAGGDQFYRERTLLIDGNPLEGNKSHPQITGVYWHDANQKQYRLYYINDDHYIQELWGNDGENWEWGARIQFKVDPSMPISATFYDGSITVFYSPPGSDWLWSTSSADSWGSELQVNNTW